MYQALYASYIRYVDTHAYIMSHFGRGCLLLFFQEIPSLLNFHYDVGHEGLEIYPCIQFRLPQCFSLSVTCTYIRMPL